jgi:predicted secreted protein
MIKTNMIIESDNGKIFEYDSQEEFDIYLAENPVTSFEWAMKPIVSEGIELLSTNFHPLLPKKAGSGGGRVYRFKAKKTGIFKIVLDLKRFHDGKINKTFEVTVKVNKP